MLNPRDAAKLAETMTKIERSVTNINTLVSRAMGQTKKDADDIAKGMKGIGDAGTKALKDFQAEIEDTVALSTSMITDMGAAFTHVFDGAKAKLTELERTPFFKMLTGNTEANGILSGKQGKGIVDGVGSIRDSIMAGIPGGGLIGLMIFGGDQNEKFRSQAARVSSIMLSTSKDAMSSIEQVKASMMGLHGVVDPAEFGATFEALASAGIGDKAAKGKTPGVSSGYGSSIYEALQGADHLFSMPQGSAAKLAAQAVQDTGESIERATLQIYKFGSAVQGTGANVGTFLGILGQAGSALRMQRQDLDGIAQAYMALGDSIRKSNPGASDQYVAKGAGASLGQLASNIADMPDTFKNFLMMKEGHGNNAMQNLYDFDTASSGKDANAFIKHLNTILDLSRQFGGNNSAEQYRYLTAGPAHMSKESAQAMLAFNSSKYQGMSAEDILKKMPQAMKDSLGVQTAKVDQFELLAEKIQIALGSLGEVLITALGGILKILTYGFAAMIYAMNHWTSTIAGTDNTSSDIFAAGFAGFGSSMKKSLGNAGKSLGAVGGQMSNAFDAVFGATQAPTSPEDIKAFQQQRDAAESADRAKKDAEQKKLIYENKVPEHVNPTNQKIHGYSMLKDVPGTNIQLDIKVLNKNADAERYG